jgi:hypothetical protein
VLPTWSLIFDYLDLHRFASSSSPHASSPRVIDTPTHGST